MPVSMEFISILSMRSNFLNRTKHSNGNIVPWEQEEKRSHFATGWLNRKTYHNKGRGSLRNIIDRVFKNLRGIFVKLSVGLISLKYCLAFKGKKRRDLKRY